MENMGTLYKILPAYHIEIKLKAFGNIFENK